MTELEAKLNAYVDRRAGRLVELVQELVRRPSENKAPEGSERACQDYAAGVLSAAGLEPDVYELSEVPGLEAHPLYFAGRNYQGRPNLGARRRGAGGGRSLVLSGHIDTVPAGTQPWTRDPFGGSREGDRLYGRGSNDMKGGDATNLFVAEALAELGIELKGDLIFETVVDEEFGGVNGTLAGRLRGYVADAAIISEPSFLRICPAQRGGRTAHITLRTSGGGILQEGDYARGVEESLAHLLSWVPEFSRRRRASAPSHPSYAASTDPVPVSVLKISTGPWGTGEPMTVPWECRVELFWQSMPGEPLEELHHQFEQWFNEVKAARPDLFRVEPSVEFPIRWLPGSAIDHAEPLVETLADCRH
ncbi:MAG: M20/M25/M40 family metallo-hydrolase [Acidobacteria bacterium]|nr:M20/M25/M40 family metallo-hydrolase [Acidobacteriota bacterium]